MRYCSLVAIRKRPALRGESIGPAGRPRFIDVVLVWVLLLLLLLVLVPVLVLVLVPGAWCLIAALVCR